MQYRTARRTGEPVTTHRHFTAPPAHSLFPAHRLADRCKSDGPEVGAISVSVALHVPGGNKDGSIVVSPLIWSWRATAVSMKQIDTEATVGGGGTGTSTVQGAVTFTVTESADNIVVPRHNLRNARLVPHFFGMIFPGATPRILSVQTEKRGTIVSPTCTVMASRTIRTASVTWLEDGAAIPSAPIQSAPRMNPREAFTTTEPASQAA